MRPGGPYGALLRSLGSTPVEEEPTAEPPAEEEKDKPEWKWRFDLGFTGSAGVTNETSLRVGLTGRYRDPLKFYRVDSAYILKTTDSATTDNEFNADVLGDWKFGELPVKLTLEHGFRLEVLVNRAELLVSTETEPAHEIQEVIPTALGLVEVQQQVAESAVRRNAVIPGLKLVPVERAQPPSSWSTPPCP